MSTRKLHPLKASKTSDPVEAFSGVAAGLGDDEVVVLVGTREGVEARSVTLPPGARIDVRRGVELAALMAQALGQGQLQREPEAQLTAAEQGVLRAGGFEPASGDGPLPALDAGQLGYLKLLDTALTVEQAAARLKVNGSRVRQRILAGELLALKDGRSWRLPRFQFLPRRLLPGIDEVMPALRGLHPVAIRRWFDTPQPDLEGPDGRVFTPLKWLQGGHAVEAVVELARHAVSA